MEHNDQTIKSVLKCQKATTRLLRHDQSVPRGIDGAVHNNDIIEECRRKKFDDASQWLLGDWISKLAKGGGAKKHIPILCESQTRPINSCTFEQFQDIQEKVLWILRCKTIY